MLYLYNGYLAGIKKCTEPYLSWGNVYDFFAGRHRLQNNILSMIPCGGKIWRNRYIDI